MIVSNATKLGVVAEFIRGITFKPDDVVPLESDGSVACMRTKNVQIDLDLNDVWGVPQAFVKRAEQFLREGDIIVSTANSWNLVGKCCWVPDLPWPATIGGFVSALRADARRLYPRFLYHWLVTDATQARIRSCARQTTNIANLSIPQSLEIEIPLPPLEEQKRIAAILDQADELRRKRQRALDRLNQLEQAIFVEMFGDLLRNDKGWPTGGTLGDHTEIVSGITKGRDPKGRPTRAIPYLAVVNVQDKSLNLAALKHIDATEEEIRKYALEIGDLLLTEGGDPDKLGRGTLWNSELPECIHQNHVFRVRLRSESFNPAFLNWLVGSDYGKQYFLRAAKQTTGIASINMSQLKAFPMLLPPIRLQEEFSQKLDRLRRFREGFFGAVRSSEALFSSLQHRAFRGELTGHSLSETVA